MTDRHPRFWLRPLAVWAAVMAWLVGWVAALGSTLINDEYAAIDYFARIVRTGSFYPTPDKLHKPLSVAMGFFAWLTDSPLGYELVICAFGALFVTLLWLVARRELGPIAGAVAAIAIALHPDLMYLSITGSTIIPFCAFTFLAILAVQRRAEGQRWLWVYAGCFAIAGLLRPESWLFAGLIPLWWWPRDRRGWLRVIAAGAIVGIAPVLWFGGDYLINGDFMHGMKIAVRDKTIGMGKPFTMWKVTSLYWLRVANILSWPVAAAVVPALALFFRERGRRGLIHPFLVFPALVSAYIWLIVYQGVFPVQRYYYYDSIFAIIFVLFLVRQLARGLSPDRWLTAGQLGASAALIGAAVSAWQTGEDGQGLLIAAGLVAGAGAIGLALGPALVKPARSTVAAAAIALLALSFTAFSAGYYVRVIGELRLEAAKQAQLVDVSKWLKTRLTPRQRLLLPTRRNEQFSWLWRDQLPETFFFREIYYLHHYRGVEILDLHPDWIIWLDNDFQFWGPQDLYGWLGKQDRTEIKNAVIQLQYATPLIRVFRVAYPAGWPPKGPMPSIP